MILSIAAYSFVFDVQLIPIQCQLIGNDVSGNRAKKAAWISLTIAILLYCGVIA